MDALADALEAAGGEFTTINASIAALQGRATDLEARATNIEADLAGVVTRLGAAEAGITDLQGDLGALDTRLDAAEGSITDLQTDLSALDTQVSDMRAAVAAVPIPALTVAPVAGTPTAADFNKAVADITALRAALVAIQGALSP